MNTEPLTQESRALTYRRRIFLLFWVVLFFLLDQGCKIWVQTAMGHGQSFAIIPDVFHITLVHNTGAAFSLLNNQPAFLLGLTLVLFVGFLVYALRKPVLSRYEVAALALIMGGALGNIADRVMLGRVVDFLDFTLIDYPIFNLADVFIFSGICLVLYRYVRADAPHPDKPSADEQSSSISGL